MISPPSKNAARLQELLLAHAGKRIIVLGTTCTGKSTLVGRIEGARDQDSEIFPLLSPEESAYVCQTPWTPEIGRTMTRLVREKIRSEAGRPLFGTVVVDADLIVLLNISDELLAERATRRGVNVADARAMRSQLEHEARTSGIPVITFNVSND